MVAIWCGSSLGQCACCFERSTCELGSYIVIFALCDLYCMKYVGRCVYVCVLFSHTRSGFRGHYILLHGVMYTAILRYGVGSTPGGVLLPGTLSAVTGIEGTMISWCSSHNTYCMCLCLMLRTAHPGEYELPQGAAGIQDLPLALCL